MSRSTRIELSILAAVLLVVATPFLLPVNIWRAPIESAASSALGREVRIRGPLHLSIYPDIGLRLSDVLVANPAGIAKSRNDHRRQRDRRRQNCAAFSGHLEVTELTLQDATIDLENSSDGMTNWSFGEAPASGQKRGCGCSNRIGLFTLKSQA